MSNLGRRIRTIRVSRGLSQDDLAAAIGRSRAWMSNVERGATIPNGAMLDAIGAAIGTSASLVHGTASASANDTLDAEIDRHLDGLRQRVVDEIAALRVRVIGETRADLDLATAELEAARHDLQRAESRIAELEHAVRACKCSPLHERRTRKPRHATTPTPGSIAAEVREGFTESDPRGAKAGPRRGRYNSARRGSIAAQVREHRFAHGWTQEQLAEAAGLSRMYITFIETGRKTPSSKALAKIFSTGNVAGYTVDEVLAELPEEARVAAEDESRLIDKERECGMCDGAGAIPARIQPHNSPSLDV